MKRRQISQNDVEPISIVNISKSEMTSSLQSRRTNLPRPKIVYITLCAFLISATLFILYRNTSNDDLGEEVSLPELREARDSLRRAMEQPLAKLRQIDKNKFIVRINTWRRNEQLIASVNHYLTCPNVAQIQVVWCDESNQPPMQLFENNHKSKPIVVERHSINSLNERFRILPDTLSAMPTLGVLSVDDDVLRSCEAMDAGFYRWTDHPDRIVGFDFRVHMILDHGREDRIDKNPIWSYGYLSSSQKRNQYSITLPRFCFIHRDYLNLYMKYAPKRIIETVGDQINCEDIAMSFFVSALTKGKVPLLTDFWASMPSMGSQSREMWGSFSSKQTVHGTIFGMGDDVDEKSLEQRNDYVPSRKDFINTLVSWIENVKKTRQKIPFQIHKNELHHRMKALGLIKT
eukprot:scaffold111_cov201-Chaetoceros_neogracile.AAC.1